MRTRWLLIAVFTIALGALGYYVAINTEWREITLPMPLRGEAATNPQYTMQAFMRELGAEVHIEQSLLSMPPTDAVIVLKNWHWDLIESRREKLQAWVQAGGRLIVDNTVVGNLRSFAEWSGIERHFPADKSTDKKEDTSENNQKIKGSTPTSETPQDTTSNDESGSSDSSEAELDNDLQADKDENSDESNEELSINSNQCTTWTANNAPHNKEQHYRDSYRLCSLVKFGWLTSKTAPLWSLRDEHGIRVLRIAVGKGSLTFYNVLPFDNRAFTEADHAALSVAITQLHPHDQVWFITESEQASILMLAWRYGSPVVILIMVFIAAALWRNAIRFGPQAAPTETSRRSLAELIRGSGWFYERQGDAHLLDAAVDRALRETAERHIRGFANLSPTKQVAALAIATGYDEEHLQAAMQSLAPQAAIARIRSRHERRRAISLLETARRKLLETMLRHQIAHSSSKASSNLEPNS